MMQTLIVGAYDSLFHTHSSTASRTICNRFLNVVGSGLTAWRHCREQTAQWASHDKVGTENNGYGGRVLAADEDALCIFF